MCLFCFWRYPGSLARTWQESDPICRCVCGYCYTEIRTTLFIASTVFSDAKPPLRAALYICLYLRLFVNWNINLIENVIHNRASLQLLYKREKCMDSFMVSIRTLKTVFRDKKSCMLLSHPTLKYNYTLLATCVKYLACVRMYTWIYEVN